MRSSRHLLSHAGSIARKLTTTRSRSDPGHRRSGIAQVAVRCLSRFAVLPGGGDRAGRTPDPARATLRLRRATASLLRNELVSPGRPKSRWVTAADAAARVSNHPDA